MTSIQSWKTYHWKNIFEAVAWIYDKISALSHLFVRMWLKPKSVETFSDKCTICFFQKVKLCLSFFLSWCQCIRIKIKLTFGVLPEAKIGLSKHSLGFKIYFVTFFTEILFHTISFSHSLALSNSFNLSHSFTLSQYFSPHISPLFCSLVENLASLTYFTKLRMTGKNYSKTYKVFFGEEIFFSWCFPKIISTNPSFK